MESSTWVVIADASTASVIASDDHLNQCELVSEFAHPLSRAKGSELMSGDRGRTRPRHKDASRGAAMAYKTTPHDVEADTFSRELAHYLRSSRNRNEYETLILVAPPSFLGRLRGALDDPTRDCVRASVAKDYTSERSENALARVRNELV